MTHPVAGAEQARPFCLDPQVRAARSQSWQCMRGGIVLYVLRAQMPAQFWKGAIKIRQDAREQHRIALFEHTLRAVHMHLDARTAGCFTPIFIALVYLFKPEVVMHHEIATEHPGLGSILWLSIEPQADHRVA